MHYGNVLLSYTLKEFDMLINWAHLSALFFLDFIANGFF